MITFGLLAVFLIVVYLVIPAFWKFAPEARANLKDIFDKQVAYHDRHKKYASGDNCFTDLGWKPEYETRYSYYCGQSHFPCTKCERECPAPPLAAPSAQGFTIIAVGNIDKDPECDLWTMNDTGKLVHVASDL